MVGIMKMAKSIEANGPKTILKLNRMVPHTKVALAKICPEEMWTRILGHYTNTKDNSKIKLPTRVLFKVENHPLLKKQKLV